MERETFEGALGFGRAALTRLGLSERRATKAASLFREMDLELFHKLAPTFGEQENYIMATRDSRDTMERLLQAEMKRLSREEAEEADNDGSLQSGRRLEAS